MHSVLVIDDDDTLRGVLRSWVDTLGYRAREANSAEEALLAMDREPADIALCDVNMPGESGLWLACRLRERYPETAVIMASAARDIDTALASVRTEAVDYLMKPFDRARLNEALTLGRDFHNALKSKSHLHHALRERLRSRRASVAAAVAEAQHRTEDAINGLISMLQLHERDGRAHATRVARLAVAIAEELGLREEAVTLLETGAMLHDIGKLDMPLSILSKPAPLDDREWQVMRTHPQVGYDLLKGQPRLADAAEIVLSHHEAYDGSGYPRGLAGTEIPLAARILTVADSYDSMTMPHTQRPPMPPVMAVREIERCRGRQFDPCCAEALGDVFATAADEERVA